METPHSETSVIMAAVLFLVPYIALCMEFPRTPLDRPGPWWMDVLKFWGGILILSIGSTILEIHFGHLH